MWNYNPEMSTDSRKGCPEKVSWFPKIVLWFPEIVSWFPGNVSRLSKILWNLSNKHFRYCAQNVKISYKCIGSADQHSLSTSWTQQRMSGMKVCVCGCVCVREWARYIDERKKERKREREEFWYYTYTHIQHKKQKSKNY